MEGNKLKHSFVKKDEAKETFFNEWLRLVGQQRPEQYTIEQSFRNYEGVFVQERVTDSLLAINNENFGEYLKIQMSHKLAKILLEEGFIDFTTHSNIYTDYTDFKMRIKVIRNPENNVR